MALIEIYLGVNDLKKFLVLSISLHLQALMMLSTYQYLHVEEQHQLMSVLQKYEHLLGGTLREFNIVLITLQLIDTN
jgi:hypothetical protein